MMKGKTSLTVENSDCIEEALKEAMPQATILTNEIAQIAGRAGRSSKNGTFGVISEDLVFEKNEIQMVESHDFPSLQKIWWRNT